ncbi:MAG TPA: hypothetical protein VLJ76_03440 [Gaiellaceae bacterium]|nr:hypothetical protein [Gaiellaceae bacterium]
MAERLESAAYDRAADLELVGEIAFTGKLVADLVEAASDRVDQRGKHLVGSFP